MTNAYVIEVAGQTVGIIARDQKDEAYTFFASQRAFHGLEGKRFGAPAAASQAARRLIEDQRNVRSLGRREAS